MDNNTSPLKVDNLTPALPNELISKSHDLFNTINTPEMNNYMAQQAQKQIMKNLIQSSSEPVLKNPHEKVENLLEEQLKQYESANNELHKQLEDSQLQLKQLDDKVSAQNIHIKELKADLKDEMEKRIIAENMLSPKDWKLTLIGFVFGMIATVVGGFILNILTG